LKQAAAKEKKAGCDSRAVTLHAQKKINFTEFAVL
jgi:hypothetical protein